MIAHRIAATLVLKFLREVLLVSPVSTTSEVRIVVLDGQQAQQHMDEFVALLLDAVADGASVNFLSALTAAEAQAFWEPVFEDVSHGRRLLLAACRGEQVVGSVQLALAWQPNAPHRAEVQKLLVLRSQRRHGIGQRLMEVIEQQALAQGRTLLVLDTAQGSNGEHLYRRMGYQELGAIPRFARKPDGALESAVFFYKHLG